MKAAARHSVRILVTGAAGAAFTLLAACQTGAANPAATPSPTSTSPTSTPPTSTPPQTRPQATSPTGEQAQVQPGFTYRYPDIVAARNPGLKAHMVGLEASAKAVYDAMVTSYDNSAGGPPASALISMMRWVADSETAGLTVLLGEGASYEGGAHGMNWTETLIWDRKAHKALAFADLFTDAPRAKAALLPAYCSALDKARFDKRGKATAKTDIFGDCPDPFESKIFPTGADTGRFTKLGFSLAPYVAGPYVEGQYNFTIPLDAAVRALVKPEYRALFAAK